ncbi:hypothetical protein H8D29_06965 [PVC group bacterium]|nr:hypothetical protein [PVC group bacterium]
MNKHFVIQSRSLEDGATPEPLGTRSEIVEALSHLNTMPESEGEDTLWGPGIRIELPPTEDPIHQMLLHIVEDEIAWYPIVRFARRFNWCVVDIETGREMKP